MSTSDSASAISSASVGKSYELANERGQEEEPAGVAGKEEGHSPSETRDRSVLASQEL